DVIPDGIISVIVLHHFEKVDKALGQVDRQPVLAPSKRPHMRVSTETTLAPCLFPYQPVDQIGVWKVDRGLGPQDNRVPEEVGPRVFLPGHDQVVSLSIDARRSKGVLRRIQKSLR